MARRCEPCEGVRAFRATRTLQHPGPIGPPIHLADALECDLCGNRFAVDVPPSGLEGWSPSQGLDALVRATAPALAGEPEPVYRPEAVVRGAIRSHSMWSELSRRVGGVFALAARVAFLGSSRTARLAGGGIVLLAGLALLVPWTRRVLRRKREAFVLERVTRSGWTREALVAARDGLRGTDAVAVELLEGLLSRDVPRGR